MVEVGRQGLGRRHPETDVWLPELEAVMSPTPLARNRLKVLQLCTLDANERRRVDVVAARWGAAG